MRRSVALAASALAVAAFAHVAQAAPTITPTVTAGTPGDNGWYRSDVTVQVVVQGATSSNCQAVYTFQANGSINCTATDGTFTVSLVQAFFIDKVPPAVTSAAPDRAPNGNGWFNSPVTVTFSGADATSGIAACSQVGYGGPDTGGAAITGSCRDIAGNVSAPGSYTVRYDATAPGVSPAPDRGPDVNGWYNHPFSVAFNGSDGTSGVDGCSSASYSGPDNGSASVSGSCTDKAGNTGGASYGFKYDSTPPQLGGLSITPGNRRLGVRWQLSGDVAGLTINRLPVKRGAANTVIYRGKAAHAFTDKKLTNGLRYKYTIVGADEAGNSTTIAGFAAPSALLTPRDAEKVKKPPLLKWAKITGAPYYNVQLYRGSKKILSAWPEGTKLQLPRRWTYLRTRYKLVPGRYRWYVWPGVGPRRNSKYGKLLGGSTFRVVR
jgi:hypothetical protein